VVRPCRTLGPVLEKVAAAFGGRVKLVRINSDENQELSAAFGVRSIPNVIAFKDGRAVAQFAGALPETEVQAFFAKLLPSPAEVALQRAEEAFAAQRLDEAEQLLAAVPRDFEIEVRITALEQGIAYARAGQQGPSESELHAKLAADANDHEARFALASLYGGQRRYRDAMEELVELVRRARTWRDGVARTQLLALFTLAANDAALVAEYRRKLASSLH
jgi:putative thioredoxin